MTIQVNLDGRKRKELAKVMGEVLNATVTYAGVPTYEYKVGKATISKDGTVTFKTKNIKDATTMNRLLEGLREHGFDHLLMDEEGPLGEFSNDAITSSTPLRETPFALRAVRLC